MPFLHREQNVVVVFADFRAAHVFDLIIGEVAGGFLADFPRGTGTVAQVAFLRRLFQSGALPLGECKRRRKRNAGTNRVPCLIRDSREGNVGVEVAEFGALAPEPERDFLLPREFLPQAGQLCPER